MQKNKIFVIAAIVAAVILVAAGITVAVVLSGSYLDSMKDYNFTEDFTYNGVEIVEDDGLFYLTKNGKKLSRKGYTYLQDLNSDHYSYNYNEFSAQDILAADDFVIYDYYLARKPDAEGLLLVNTDGDEIAIEGENLYFYGTYLPYVQLKDSVTGEYGVISLDALDSDLSVNAGKEISLTMFDGVEFEKLDDDGVRYDYVIAENEDVAVNAPSYTYFDTEGTKLFASASYAATPYDIYDENGKNLRYFVTGEGKLYGLDGKLIASDVENVEALDEYMLVSCMPTDEALSAEANALKAYVQVISWKIQFVIDNTKYDLETAGANGNLVWLSERKDGVATGKYRLFNLITGETSDEYAQISSAGAFLVKGELNGSYAYIDAETGKVLCTSQYDDMTWYCEGVLASVKEFAAKTATMTNNLPASYLHFVKGGQDERTMTLALGQSVEPIVVRDELTVYKVTTVDSTSNVNYSISSTYAYFPFSASAAKTASYDKIEVLNVFANAAPIAVGTDYEAGKYDIIDLVNGEVLRTVSAQGAEMAKTSISHNSTQILAVDGTKRENAVDIAMLSIVKIDDNQDVASTEWVAISRGAVMTEKGDYRMAAAVLTELGDNLIRTEFHASVVEDGEVTEFSKYLTVRTGVSSTDIYELNEELELEKISTLPYFVYRIERWGDSLEDVHLIVGNLNGSMGLYDVNGTQILAPVYEADTIQTFGKYIIAESRNAYGLFSYNAKNGKVKQVLDFEYESIHRICGDAFVVQIGYDWYLYEGDDLVKNSPIIGEPGFGVNISIDEETGAIQCNEYFTVNIKGKFYIHREKARNLEFTDFVAQTVSGGSVITSGVKVVNFRNADGTLIESKVLYPTLKSAFEFTTPDATATWYTTGVKELQDVATQITEIELEAMTDAQVINVYKGHSASLGITG